MMKSTKRKGNDRLVNVVECSISKIHRSQDLLLVVPVTDYTKGAQCRAILSVQLIRLVYVLRLTE